MDCHKIPSDLSGQNINILRIIQSVRSDFARIFQAFFLLSPMEAAVSNTVFLNSMACQSNTL